MRRGAIIGAAAAVVAACTSSGSSTSAPPSAEAGPHVLVRSCSTAVSGSLGSFAHWSRSSLIAGPFAFVWILQAAHVPRSRFAVPQAVKVLALVRPGHPTLVTVPPAERRDVSLIYDPAAFTGGPYRVRDGEPAVRFQPCPDSRHSWAGATQFNGGVIVAGARCVSLDVRVQGARPRRVRAAFGAGTCRRGR